MSSKSGSYLTLNDDPSFMRQRGGKGYGVFSSFIQSITLKIPTQLSKAPSASPMTQSSGVARCAWITYLKKITTMGRRRTTAVAGPGL